MKTKNSVWLLSYAAMVAYAFFVGFTFMATKVCVTAASSGIISLTWRYTAAMLSALLLQAAGIIHIGLKKGSMKNLLITSCTYVGFMGFQAFGLLYTTSIVSGILFALVPVFARIVSGVLLGETSSWKQNLFAALSVFSVVAMFAISGRDTLSSIDPFGFALLLLSSLSCAVSNVFMRYVKKDYGPLTISYYNCAVGFVFFWLVSLVQCFKSGSWGSLMAPVHDPSFVAAVSYLGFICTLFTGALISYALRTLPAMTGTIFGNLSTAISVVAGALFMHEALYPYQVICTVLIIVGVLGICICTPKK